MTGWLPAFSISSQPLDTEDPSDNVWQKLRVFSRDPKRELGKIGVIEEGALADVILVNGNPLKGIDIVTDPDNNFVVIMNDGKIYKNTLGE